MSADDLLQWVGEAHCEVKPSRDLTSHGLLCIVLCIVLRRDMNVSSRKITNRVSKRSAQRVEDIIMEATAFTLEINGKIAERGLRDENIWNSDQSGFEYERLRNRTLEYRGTRVVEAGVVHMMAITHRYTIQHKLFKAGTLGKQMNICFRDPSGKGFGSLVQQELSEVLATCQNVKVNCSKSGKLTTPLLQKWFTDVLSADLRDEPSMLLLDAWGGQGPSAELAAHGLSIEYISKGATKYVQPVDVFFFRQHKLFVKNIVERCRNAYFRKETTMKPSNGYFIIKMHSFCLNQFQHPRFSPM